MKQIELQVNQKMEWQTRTLRRSSVSWERSTSEGEPIGRARAFWEGTRGAAVLGQLLEAIGDGEQEGLACVAAKNGEGHWQIISIQALGQIHGWQASVGGNGILDQACTIQFF